MWKLSCLLAQWLMFKKHSIIGMSAHFYSKKGKCHFEGLLSGPSRGYYLRQVGCYMHTMANLAQRITPDICARNFFQRCTEPPIFVFLTSHVKISNKLGPDNDPSNGQTWPRYQLHNTHTYMHTCILMHTCIHTYIYMYVFLCLYSFALGSIDLQDSYSYHIDLMTQVAPLFYHHAHINYCMIWQHMAPHYIAHHQKLISSEIVHLLLWSE